ncbi:unnamed protein product [Schistosoma mattheei]|uniref:Uncharacterized protein n=1 Tax=Schistosoma mattheei TaxID=31246 RepID=A0A3P8CR64_9TREM|nr:unnamed protein product [Schistosoma mattheei]
MHCYIQMRIYVSVSSVKLQQHIILLQVLLNRITYENRQKLNLNYLSIHHKKVPQM